MKNLSIFFILFLLIVSRGEAQEAFGFGFMNISKERCVSEAQVRFIAQEITKNQKRLRLSITAVDPVLFDWPMRQRGVTDYGHYAISNFVDLDPTAGIRDYNCGSRTYDAHTGTDIFTAPYSWAKMDSNNVEVIAGAPGTIIYKSDGNYDRQCQWINGTNWNAVYVQHADGTVAWYGHLKSGSLTAKSVGATVQTGEYLGIVGSSGYSTGPHLHFELRDSGGNVIDPYTGSCGNAASRWRDQRPYYDFSVAKLMVHNSSPIPFPACPTTADNLRQKASYAAGEAIYLAVYLRDQNGQSAQLRILKPNGTVWLQWNNTFNNYYSSSYWWWSYTLPASAETGTWKFEATFAGVIYETTFNVNTTQAPCPSTRNLITNVNQVNTQLTANQTIVANNLIEPTATITLKAGRSVLLSPGFQAQKGAAFSANIQGCP
ncbi:MAG: peptidoglycan DD-metalloendopeptidase family protein [Spirosomataceae bacterium]